MKKYTLAILITLVLTIQISQATVLTPGFQTNEFPKGMIFSAKDKISFDMSQYLSQTYNLAEININPPNTLNFQVTQPFDSSSSTNTYSTEESSCSVATILQSTMDFVMLCGNHGTSLVRVDYERTKIRALSHKSYDIKKFDKLSDLNISHCSSIADVENNSMLYVTCHGEVSPTLLQSKVPTLHVLAFSTLNSKIELKGYKSIEQTEQKLIGITNKIFINSGFEKDRITILNVESQEGQTNSFAAWTLTYAGGQFSQASYLDKSDVLNWPISSKETDQILYDIVTSEQKIYMVRRKGKKESSLSDLPSPIFTNGNEKHRIAQATSQDYTWELFDCGIPTNIKKTETSAETTGLKCKPISGELLKQPIDFIGTTYIKFTVQNENYLRPSRDNIADITYFNKKLFGYSYITSNSNDELQVTSSRQFKELEDFTKVYFPQETVRIKNKIYLFGNINEGTTKNPKPITYVWVFNTRNEALSKAYKFTDEGVGTIFLKMDYFQGDADDIFFIQENKGKLFSKKIKENIVTLSLKDPSSAPPKQDVTVTFKVKVSDDKTITKDLKFTIYNNSIGPYSANMGERKFTSYTESLALFPAYSEDFSGNGLSFKATASFTPNKSSSNSELKQEGNIPTLVSYGGARPMKFVSKEILDSKFEMNNINYAVYLRQSIYVVSDKNQGLVFMECRDAFTTNFNANTQCTYKYRIPKDKLKYENKIIGKEYTYDVVKEGIDANSHYIIRLYDSKNESQALVWIEQIFDTDCQWKLFPVKGKLQSAAMKVMGDHLIWLSIKKPEGKSTYVFNTMRMKITTQLPESLGVLEPVNNIPFDYICPVRVELFPHESEEFALYSVCKFESDIVKRIFHFKFMLSSKGEALIDQWALLRTHDLNRFETPQFCLTDKHLHVFEKGKINEKTENNIYIAIKADETNGTEYVIPIKDMAPELTSIRGHYCDWTKDSVVLTTYGEDQKSKQIITVNTEFIHLPNKRVHSVLPNTKPNFRVVSGGSGDNDSIIIMTFKEEEGELEGYYASLDGPHFMAKGYNLKEEGSLKLSIQMIPQVKTKSEIPAQTITANLVKPLLQGTMEVADPQKPLPEIMELPGDDTKGYKMDLTQNFKFTGPVLSVTYNSKEGKTESEKTNKIDHPVEENNKLWKNLKGEFLMFQTNDDYAAVVFPDKGKVWIQFWKGKDADKPTLLRQGAVNKVISMDILKYNDDYILLAAVLNENEWEVVCIYEKKPPAPPKSGNGLELTQEGESGYVYQQIYDPEDLLIPDGAQHIKFYNYKVKGKGAVMPGLPSMNVSIFGYTNDSRTQVFNSNIDINTITGNFKINRQINRVFFDSPIKDIGISFQPRPKANLQNHSAQLDQGLLNFKTAAVVIVMLSNNKKFTAIAFPFDDNNGLSFNIGAQQTFSLNEGEDRFFQHVTSVIDCDSETKPDSSDVHKLECAVLTGSTKSVILELEIEKVANMRSSKKALTKFGYSRAIYNLPGYLPFRLVKDRESIIAMLTRDPSKMTYPKSEVLNQPWLIAIYKSKVGNYPVEILTADTLKTTANLSFINLFHRIIHEKDGSQYDELFISTGGDIASSLECSRPHDNNHASTRLFNTSDRVLQSNDPRNIISYNFKPGYVFTIKNREQISPIKDKFIVKSYLEEQTLKVGKFFTNKKEPFPVVPSSSSSGSSGSSTGEKKKESSSIFSKLWIWLIILVVILLIALVCFVVNQKNDEELVYMKAVGEDEIDELGEGKESVQDGDASNMSFDSRL